MERLKDYLFLHLSVMMFSFTSVFSKFASREFNAGGLKNPRLYLFVFLMFFVCFLYAFCWQKIIKKFDLNIGFANRSVYLLWSQLWAVTIFGEHLTVRNVIGLFIVLAGVIVVSLSAGKDENAGNA
ncbi:MAG: EamA-like transporter family protein [Lachnospiraceae bacterium]|uniref:EamA-like transporter family protein n=1 Tax=Parablautia sp. Marseille-Q6255 TaxID=3039593 RepID=UPI0024BCF537|nr:EamA-like transporter family protein [Parablautia sp. Marseille-Q6255]